MSEPWMDGLIHDPGSVSPYLKGHNRMEMVKLHYTAGTNSYERCKNGTGTPWGITLCQFLLPKDGTPWQFAPADALCYDSGDFNDDGPGIEFERLSYDDPLSSDQLLWGGRIIAWLHNEWGVPLDHYRGPRFQTAGFRGFVDHKDLDANRSDGVTDDEWTALTTTVTPQPIIRREYMMVRDPSGSGATYIVGETGKRYLGGPEANAWGAAGITTQDMAQVEIDKIPDAVGSVGAAGSPLSITLTGTAQ